MKQVNVKLQNEDNPYVKVPITDRHGKKKYMFMHGYLIGLEAAIQLKKHHKWHSLVILTGDVGDGKSSLTEGLAGVDATFSGHTLGLDNVSWSTEKFIEKTDNPDNIGTPQWWDEAIQGAGGRSMAISKMGFKLKSAFVTKRFKKHTYYLVLDEISEYSWKLIKMCDAWIHVKKFGLKRGYFNVYAKKSKIQFLYNAFKFHNKTWMSPLVRNVNPDCKGKFDNYSDLFIDEVEYNEAKMQETRQLEEESGISWKEEKVKAFGLWCKGTRQVDISEILGVKTSTLANWVAEFKKILLP